MAPLTHICLLSGTGKLCGIEYFKSVFSQIYRCAHMVDFCWPDHICS